jgi:cation transport regulator ChaC
MFPTRERAGLNKLADVTGEIGEFVHQQQHSESDGQHVANNLASLLERVAGTTVREIDYLIAELQTLREKLQNEAERVQHEVAEFATLSQSATESTKVISESLRSGFHRPGD